MVALDDVAAGAGTVVWLNDNIWRLTARHPKLAAKLGFSVGEFDAGKVTGVRYRGVDLTRDPDNPDPVMRLKVTDPAKARVVGEVLRATGDTLPWGVRSGNLTYLGELPLTYVGPDDRYLAFADLLFDLLAPKTTARHRALVRAEGVAPPSAPAQLRAIADLLAGRGVPFSVAVISGYDDATGRYPGGVAVHRRLSDAPELVAALRYAADRGGTLIMHGYTHGAATANPYGVSGEDFEFYRAHVDPANQVVLDGPMVEDSAAWATARIQAARAEWLRVGLPPATIFEFPHYAASATDYRTVSAAFGVRYERAMYHSGVLSGGTVDHTRFASQYFPYAVRDVYGAQVIPESLGNVQTLQFNQHQARLPAEIVASARRQLVVRDGVASFFYHPFLGLPMLTELVAGMQSMGYTFVAPEAVLPGAR